MRGKPSVPRLQSLWQVRDTVLQRSLLGLLPWPSGPWKNHTNKVYNKCLIVAFSRKLGVAFRAFIFTVIRVFLAYLYMLFPFLRFLVRCFVASLLGVIAFEQCRWRRLLLSASHWRRMSAL